MSAEYAQKMLDRGFNLVTVGSDQRFMSAGAKTSVEKMKNIKSIKATNYDIVTGGASPSKSPLPSPGISGSKREGVAQ